MSGRSTVFTFIGKDEFSKVAGSVEKSASGMSGKMGKAGLLVAGGVAAVGTAAVATGAFLASAAKSAAEDERSQAALAKSLRNSAGARDEDIAKVEAWISKTGEATGVADDKMRPALERLARSTGSVGEAQDLMSVAMDASAGTGKSLQAVSDAMAKAHDGNTGALGRLGVVTKDAEGKALSYDQIMQNMAGTFSGQTAAAADTVDGKFARLKLTFDEAKESIGAKLLPALTSVGSWVLETGVPALREFGERVMPKLREAWSKISEAFENAKPGLQVLWDGFKMVAGVIVDKVIPVVVSLYSKYLSKMLEVFGKIGEALPGIASTILGFASTAVGGFKSMYTAVTGVLEGILTVAEQTLGWIPGIGEKITAAKEGFSTFRDTTITKLGEVEAGLGTAATKVDEYGEKAKNVKQAELKADLTDLESKLTTAKNKLGDEDLTKERKAALKADIADLTEKVATAKEKIASVEGKTVTVGVNVNIMGKEYYQAPGTNKKIPLFTSAMGGLIRGPGTATSDSIPAMLSNGEYVMRAAAVQRYGSQFFDALNGGMSAGGGGGTSAPSGGGVTVNIYGGLDSAETIARTVQRSLLDLKRRQGVNLGLA